jgi:hypothetical protein
MQMKISELDQDFLDLQDIIATLGFGWFIVCKEVKSLRE